MAETWLKCSECRKDIPFGAQYYVCSVSTCTKGKIKFQFCSVICWDSHLSSVRHRDAGAIEMRAPSKEQWTREQGAAFPAAAMQSSASPSASPSLSPSPSASSSAPVRRIVGESGPTLSTTTSSVTPGTPGTVTLSAAVDHDILIVVSKLKKYIKDRSGFNCSDSVADLLSEHGRAVADEAIRTAARDDRKTVLDRDVPRARRA